MYQWTHTESQRPESLVTPGKLNSSEIWPHIDSPTVTKMPSVQFMSTPKPAKTHPELSEVKTIINKCETIDELCNTMQKLLLQDSANMRILNLNNCSMINKQEKQNNSRALGSNVLNNNNDDQSVCDMSEYVTGSASMFQSALENTEDLIKVNESCNTTKNNNEKSNLREIITKSDCGVQTENSCEKNVITNDKEVQTESEQTKIVPERSEDEKKKPEKKPVAAPSIPPPAPSIPPPPPPMNIPKLPPMIPPCPPILKPLVSNGIPTAPIPPPPSAGKAPGILLPPPLPLPSKQTDWQTTISESRKCNVPCVVFCFIIFPPS